MKSLPQPTDANGQPLLPVDVYKTCISKVRRKTLKAQLDGLHDSIRRRAKLYDVRAENGELFKFKARSTVASVSGDEFVKVYTSRMVPSDSPGRDIYALILATAPHGKCPFCGIGAANTLDHYLPKTAFPAFSVVPNNLVPACQVCQGAKLEYYASSASEQLVHPYFDTLDDDNWLVASVVKNHLPVAFNFEAEPPPSWLAPKRQRVKNHMRELKLATLFSQNAGSRLAEIRLRLNSLHKVGGKDAVKAYLVEELESFEIHYRNSWNSAMYRAAAADDWFCDGGFLS